MKDHVRNRAALRVHNMGGGKTPMDVYTLTIEELEAKVAPALSAGGQWRLP